MRLEASEQITFIALVEAFHSGLRPYITHIPNGEKRTPATGAKLKKMGLTPGWPDIIYARMRGGYGGLYIEMKRRRGGGLSKAQKFVHGHLRAEGYRVQTAAGADQALAMLLEYESLEPKGGG